MRVGYAARFVTGIPKKSIEPRLRSTTRPFSCVAELIQVLQTAYRDDNIEARARRELNTLHFDWKTPMRAYLSHYNGLVEDAGIAVHLLKQTLWETLPAPLNINTVKASKDPQVTYEEFCAEITCLAYVAETNFKARRSSEAPARSKGRGAGETTASTPAAINRPARATAEAPGTIKKLTERERQDLYNRGGCYRCRQEGHIAAACPNFARAGTPKVAALATPLGQEEDFDSADEGGEDSGKE